MYISNIEKIIEIGSVDPEITTQTLYQHILALSLMFSIS